jgi:hypothetical protein
VESVGTYKDEEDQPAEARLEKVKWIGTNFATGGDSGALVFVKENNTMVPLGHHLGLPTEWPKTSVFFGLDSVGIVAAMLDLILSLFSCLVQLSFCHQGCLARMLWNIVISERMQQKHMHYAYPRM